MYETTRARIGVHDDAGAASRPRTDERVCARPGCAAPADATLTFAYASREARVEPLAAQRRPEAYDLCGPHAARTQPPRGWQLRDHRPDDERRPADVPHTPTDLGGERTVAVLAAALRSVTDAVSEDAVGDPAAGIGPAPTILDV